MSNKIQLGGRAIDLEYKMGKEIDYLSDGYSFRGPSLNRPKRK